MASQPLPRKPALAGPLAAGRPRFGWLLAVALASPGAAGAAANGPDPMAAAASSCEAASTTLAMQDCLGRDLRELDQRLERYLARAQQRLAHELGLPQEAAARASRDLAASQIAWQRFRDRHCQAVWGSWSGGTIRGPMLLTCRLRLARERLRHLWSDFLTVPDGSPALLPDPSSPPPASATPAAPAPAPARGR